VHPPPSPAWANFTLMMECTPESSRCYSVYSVAIPLAYPSRKEGGLSLVQMISTCLRGAKRKRGESTSCDLHIM
jgi:hypothetical protein